MRVLVFAGVFHPTEQEGLLRVCESFDLEARFCASLAEFETVLSSPELRISGCFIDGVTVRFETMIRGARLRADSFNLPIVLMAPEVSTESLKRAHGLGFSDVLQRGDLRGISRLVQRVRQFDRNTRPPPFRDRVVINVRDPSRARVLRWFLRNAGFDAAAGELSEEDADLFITDGCSYQKAQQYAARKPMIVLCDGDVKKKVAKSGNPLTYVFDGKTNASTVVFLVNELSRQSARDARQTRRVYYATMCSFRRHDQLQVTYGLTYNLGDEGLFIRTLAPPPDRERVSLSLTVPHQEAPLSLVGQVAWRQLYRPGAASPPGFGVHINFDASRVTEARRYRLGYKLLLDKTPPESGIPLDLRLPSTLPALH